MVVVTGGAGFIGSNLVRGLNAKGENDILIVDNLGSGIKHRNMNALDFVDYCDKKTFLDKLPKMKNIKAIFHQGACSATTERDGVYMMENNFEYSKKLFEYCQKANIPFIYASSASVYGNGDDGFVEEPLAEYPLNVYAFSKWQFDRWLRSKLSKSSGVPMSYNSQVVGLRYFNVYGPQENHKERMASVVWQFHKQISENKELKLFEGSETFLRDFIHVKDVVNVNLFFYENPEKSGIFNVGTGDARSFFDIAKIVKTLHSGSEINTIPFPKDLEGKYQAYTCADLANLRAAGYGCDFTSLEKGVEEYSRHLIEKEGWL
jgi:ADP-L-glycero-D-manno-heptose 6-epimerase